jgi:hypothetical protein
MRRLVLVLALVLAALALGTYLAGEQTEVVVVRTTDASGTPYETKVWAVDHDGDVWVRVANPGRRWYHRLQANPRAELLRAGRVVSVVAEPSTDPAVRATIDARFREKYGLVDWWYGVLLRHDPVPVRLHAVAAR